MIINELVRQKPLTVAQWSKKLHGATLLVS